MSSDEHVGCVVGGGDTIIYLRDGSKIRVVRSPDMSRVRLEHVQQDDEPKKHTCAKGTAMTDALQCRVCWPVSASVVSIPVTVESSPEARSRVASRVEASMVGAGKPTDPLYQECRSLIGRILSRSDLNAAASDLFLFVQQQIGKNTKGTI